MPASASLYDPTSKSKLNEWCQTNRVNFPLITYSKSGTPHQPIFQLRTTFCGHMFEITCGKKKIGQQMISKQILQYILTDANTNTHIINNTPTQQDVSLICSICYDRPKDHVFECGHVFCEQCAHRVILLLQSRATCPVCRSVVHNPKRIFL